MNEVWEGLRVGAKAKGDYVSCTNPWPHQSHEWYGILCRGEEWAKNNPELYAVQVVQNLLVDAHWEAWTTECSEHVWELRGKNIALMAVLHELAKKEDHQRVVDRVIKEWASRPVGTSSAGERTDPDSVVSAPGTE
jgi:hypothetical protein